MHRHTRILLTFVLIIAVHTSATVAGVPKVMPLGDSITENDWEGGYRSFLYKALTDNGYNFVYVGRNTSDHQDENLGFTLPPSYWYHEGYNSRAIWASYLPWLDDIGNAMRANTPDVMTMLVGTNDASNGTRSSVQIKDDLGSLLDSVWKYAPNTKIILSTITRMYPGYANDTIQKVNPLLPGLVAQKKALGKYIVLVDNYSALTETSDFVDGVHPSVQGYRKMTAVWYPAIAKALQETALPVEMTRFTAAARANAINLAWATATEVTNYGFEVHRKSSREPGWVKVGFVPGAGTSNAPHSYTYVDAPGPGTYAYRLKQIDVDGRFAFSAEVASTVVSASPTLEQNYPNPFNPSTRITFTLPEKAHVALRVYDVLGRVAATIVDEEVQAGEFTRDWNAPGVPSGVYFLRLQAGTYTETKRLLLAR